MTYRMEMPATIMFDVEANDEAGAIREATTALETWDDGGFDLTDLEAGRVYPDRDYSDNLNEESIRIADSFEEA